MPILKGLRLDPPLQSLAAAVEASRASDAIEDNDTIFGRGGLAREHLIGLKPDWWQRSQRVFNTAGWSETHDLPEDIIRRNTREMNEVITDQRKEIEHLNTFHRAEVANHRRMLRVAVHAGMDGPQAGTKEIDEIIDGIVRDADWVEANSRRLDAEVALEKHEVVAMNNLNRVEKELQLAVGARQDAEVKVEKLEAVIQSFINQMMAVTRVFGFQSCVEDFYGDAVIGRLDLGKYVREEVAASNSARTKMSGQLSNAVDLAKKVLAYTKHKSPTCTDADCAKCMAEIFLAKVSDGGVGNFSFVVGSRDSEEDAVQKLTKQIQKMQERYGVLGDLDPKQLVKLREGVVEILDVVDMDNKSEEDSAQLCDTSVLLYRLRQMADTTPDLAVDIRLALPPSSDGARMTEPKSEPWVVDTDPPRLQADGSFDFDKDADGDFFSATEIASSADGSTLRRITHPGEFARPQPPWAMNAEDLVAVTERVLDESFGPPSDETNWPTAEDRAYAAVDVEPTASTNPHPKTLTRLARRKRRGVVESDGALHGPGVVLRGDVKTILSSGSPDLLSEENPAAPPLAATAKKVL